LNDGPRGPSARTADEKANLSLSRSFRAEVRENVRLSPSHYLLTMSPMAETPKPKPGQFYMIGAGGSLDPLLKRPFAAFRVTAGGLQILYRVRGRGTAAMRELKAGSILEVLGPLGNPYPMPPRGRRPLVVAGGVAVASVFLLVETLVESLREKPRVIYGGRGRDELLMLEELKALAGELLISTEDGSEGRKGTAVDLLREAPADPSTLLYVCGPRGMAQAVARVAGQRGLGGYVSLEETMACGLGACLGCAVKTTEGYRMVCKDGPVFRLEEIVWER
jgi:dihydroorotate dehydrogenase electron transfer subunit